MRIGGVNVGKVKSLELAPHDDPDQPEATRVEIEIEPQFAPISTDARAILRQKTLIGETYVELTSGTDSDGSAAPVALGIGDRRLRRRGGRESGRSPRAGSSPTPGLSDATQIDEIFNALDERDPALVPALAGGRGDGDPRARPRPQRRARQPRPVPVRRHRAAADPRRGASPRSRAWCATPARCSGR